MAKSELKKKPRLEEIIEQLRDKFGSAAVQLGKDVPPISWVSSGVEKLDKMTGGGWPRGRLVEVWGPQSAGKTTIALYSCAAVQRLDPKAEVAYFDLENRFNPEWAKICGVDLNRFWRISAIPAEGALDLLIAYVKKEWPLVVVDSVVELLPEKVLKKDADEKTYSPVANVLSANLPKIVVLQTQSPTVVMLLNQVRDKVGFMFGTGQKAPGGQALFHLDSIRLRVQRKSRITLPGEEKKQVGIETAITVVKSSVGPEGRECRLGIMQGKGIVEDVDQALLQATEEDAEGQGGQ